MTNNTSNKMMSKVLLFVLFSILSIALILNLGLISAQPTVNLGTADDYVILTKAGISTTGTTAITGDIGVSPIDHTAITGFGLIGDPTTDTFLTSSLVTGEVYAANLVSPTPSNIGTSVSNMETAFTDAQGRTHTSIVNDLGTGDISGMTLTTGISNGLYKWSTGVLINAGSPTGDPNGVTLDCEGNSSAIFIFQIAQDLTVGNGAHITLIGNCRADNIFWAVDGGTGVSIGTTAQFKGNILASKAINVNTGANIEGRLLAQTAVTLDANTVYLPTPTPAATPVLTTVVMSTNSTSLVVGTTQQLNASGFDQFGSAIDAILNYTSSNVSVATVNYSTGLVTAIAVGTAVITASNGTVNATANITISASPPTPTATSSSGSSGSSSSGGSGGRCTSIWTCTSWSSCKNGMQTRTCSYPKNWCIPTTATPILSRSCDALATTSSTTATPETPAAAPSVESKITGAVTGVGKSVTPLGIWTMVIVGAGIITTLIFLHFRK